MHRNLGVAKAGARTWTSLRCLQVFPSLHAHCQSRTSKQPKGPCCYKDHVGEAMSPKRQVIISHINWQSSVKWLLWGQQLQQQLAKRSNMQELVFASCKPVEVHCKNTLRSSLGTCLSKWGLLNMSCLWNFVLILKTIACTTCSSNFRANKQMRFQQRLVDSF